MTACAVNQKFFLNNRDSYLWLKSCEVYDDFFFLNLWQFSLDSHQLFSTYLKILLLKKPLSESWVTKPYFDIIHSQSLINVKKTPQLWEICEWDTT